jgi:PAS domain S-box-containing protein
MQREFFQTLVENALDVITILSSDGIISYGSPAIERVLGYEPEELIDQSLFEFVHPDDVSSLTNAFSGGARIPGCTLSLEFRFRHKDGSWCDLEATARNLLDNRGVSGIVLSSRDITERKQAEKELRRGFKKLQRTMDGMIAALAVVVEMKDPYIKGHHQRVTRLACTMAEVMGLPEERIENIRMAGAIHDLGKVDLPSEILSKPSPLSNIEFAWVKTHPQVGCDLLKGAESLRPVTQIMLQHHERLDGSGYPKGLAGRNILLEARILAVADVVEAMSHRRSYRSAFSVDKALEEILRNKGGLYDPHGVDACLTLFTEKGFKFEEDP